MGIVTFSPWQEGTGDPSPSNVRPIHPGLHIDGIGDVYGGYLDTLGMECVETHESYTFNGSESADMEYLSQSTAGGKTRYAFSVTTITDALPGSTLDLVSNIAGRSNSSLSRTEDCLVSVSIASSKFTLQVLKTLCSNNVSSFCSWLSNNNWQVVYPLATSIHHALTSAQMKQALDYLSARTGQQIQMTNVNTDRRRIILNQPHIVTPSSAALQTFNTDMVAPLKECKVHFSPVQAGSGDPSPDNVRPISGWTGLNTFAAPSKQLIIPSSYQEFTQDGATIKCYPSGEFVVEGSFTTFGSVDVSINPIQINFQNENIDHFYMGNKIKFDKYVIMLALRDNSKSLLNMVPEWSDYYCQMQVGALGNVSMTGAATIFRFFYDVGISNCTFIPFFTKDSSINTTSISWQSEAGTVYGGYVDLIRGKLVVNRCLTTIDGTQTVQVREQYTNANSFRVARSQLPIEPAGYDESDISNYMSLANGNDANNFPAWSFYINSSTKALHVLFPKTFTTNTQVSNYFTNNPLEVSYHIQETEYAINPVTLKTLRGINNIWSDANGNIDISYWKH